jgi:adenylate kinase
MSTRIALLGLSGVGKSTLIRQLNAVAPVVHLQASALIKGEQSHRAQQPSSSEALRGGPVLANQNLLVAAFEREAAAVSLPIILDGHSIIDGRDGIVEIPSSVFAALGLSTICFLSVHPGVIAARRLGDKTRTRPFLDLESIAQHQAMAWNAAKKIAADLQCPFLDVDDGKVEDLLSLIT